jgi:hypothetical protein
MEAGMKVLVMFWVGLVLLATAKARRPLYGPEGRLRRGVVRDGEVRLGSA